MAKNFTIGGLAGAAGVNLQTIRFYERRGLLQPAGRKPSGYRIYDEGSLKRLLFIRRAKELGFTLEEIREFLGLRLDSSSGAACEVVRQKTRAKLGTVEAKISSLESVRKVLRELLRACARRSPTDECPILKAMEDKAFRSL